MGPLSRSLWTWAATLHAAAHAPAASPRPGPFTALPQVRAAGSPRAPLHAFGVEYVGIYPFGDNGRDTRFRAIPGV